MIRLGDATDISCVLQKIENPSVGFFFKLVLPFIRVFFVSLFRSSIVREAFWSAKMIYGPDRFR